jgi:hypothetical protein
MAPRRTLGGTLRDLALALLNATLLLILGIVVAGAILAAQLRGLAHDAADRVEAALGGEAQALAVRLGAAADRLAALEAGLAAGPTDAAAEALRAELAATRAEVAALRADLAALQAGAPEALAAILDRLRRALATLPAEP